MQIFGLYGFAKSDLYEMAFSAIGIRETGYYASDKYIRGGKLSMNEVARQLGASKR